MRVTILDVQAAHFDCFAVALPGRCITAAGDTLLQLWRSLNNRDRALLRRYPSNFQAVCSRRYLSIGSSGKQMAAVTPAQPGLAHQSERRGEASTESCKGSCSSFELAAPSLETSSPPYSLILPVVLLLCVMSCFVCNWHPGAYSLSVNGLT